jgi:hypothetical protein
VVAGRSCLCLPSHPLPSSIDVSACTHRIDVQVRVQRCAEDCSDKARDTLSANPSQSEVAAAQAMAIACGTKCSDDAITSLPRIETRVTDTLKGL